VSTETTELFTQLADLVATGAMRPALDRTVGLDGAADALADMAAGRLQGKVVVRPA
jgi:NADPH:quinone reductase-like Zn-dependent oxidoreductase